MKSDQEKRNPLGEEKVSRLMVRFAVPSIIAMLVSALYNIVDQLFIGQSVGTLGNAATNIAFPLSISCVALSLLFGIGGASCFNLTLGRGDKEQAVYYIGNAACMLVLSGLVLCLVAEMFLTPLLVGFGSPQTVLPYAREYVRITAVGFPFFMLTTGGGHLIRADGSPKMAMACNLSGAVINTILDAVFILGMHMGMKGAALATILGQMISGVIVIVYLYHYRTARLERRHFVVRWGYLGKIISIGMASFFNQIAMMVVQIISNNLLRHYGFLSVYGEAIPLACAGIVMKVNQVFLSFVIGLGQGAQPIESFNYGAQKYDRVRKVYCLALAAGGVIGGIACVLFLGFPRQILSMFGSGSRLYFQFGVRYFRIFLLFTGLNFLQPITSNFFTSIGKPGKGIFLSLTRQILFLLPFMVLFPMKWGIEGILYSGPVADLMAAAVTVTMAMLELRQIRRLENDLS